MGYLSHMADKLAVLYGYNPNGKKISYLEHKIKNLKKRIQDITIQEITELEKD